MSVKHFFESHNGHGHGHGDEDGDGDGNNDENGEGDRDIIISFLFRRLTRQHMQLNTNKENI